MSKKHLNSSDMKNSLYFKRAGQRLLFIIVLVLVACGSVVGAAWAFLSVETETQYNPFTSREVAVSIVENDAVITTATAITSLGETEKRIALMIPDQKSDAAVRITFSPQVLSEDSAYGNPTYLFYEGSTISAPANNKIAFGNITVHLAPNWETDWLYQDGFFYYRHILEAGNQTSDLLSGVTVSNDVPGIIELVISAEGLQPDPSVVLQAWGVSVE